MSADADRDRWAPLLPRTPIAFPADFAWGVASSAFQSEGSGGEGSGGEGRDVPNDWVAAARTAPGADASARAIPPNPGNGFWERYTEDFARVAALGFRHYRLSVEWSRVEPARGRFDEAAIDRYRAICDAARAAGLEPWVNLFHFTHPLWFAEAGGFLDESNHIAFLRYVERVGRALASHTRRFHVANESMAYVAGAYLVGEMPPFLRDGAAAMTMTRHVLALHADAHRILKGLDPQPTVATIEVYLDPHPVDPEDPGQRAAAERFDAWYHGVLLEALATGWVRIPGRAPEEIPHLKGALDVYGFNYYASTGFGASGFGSWSPPGSDPPRDAMGRAVNPEGMTAGLLRVAKALPGVPILVTENGCPTADETFRIRYVAAHLAALERARAGGAPVGGYFHWTAVDNYEWRFGFSPEIRFGLIGFDPHSGERHVKRSGHWLAEVIRDGILDPARIP